MAKDEFVSKSDFEDLVSKHNDLCDLLDSMKLNVLADFDELKYDSDEFEDDLNDIDGSGDDEDETGF